MEWKVMPQFLALACVLVIHLYARDKSIKPTLKVKYFNLLVYSTVFSIVIFLVCYFTRSQYARLPDAFLQITNILDYIGRIFVAVSLTCYMQAFILEDYPRLRQLLLLTMTPLALFTLLVLSNPVTHWFFQFDPAAGYQTGKFFNVAYALGLIYILAMFWVSLANWKSMDRTLRLVSLSFPVISIVPVAVGLILPQVILHGIPMTIVILITYLYLQNKKIVLDDLTDLQNRKAFRSQLIRQIRQQADISIVLVSLDNFKGFNQQYGQDKGDGILQEIGRFLTSLVPKYNVYRYAGDEFAILTESGNSKAQNGLPDALRSRFQKPWVMNGLYYPVKASIAMTRVTYPTDPNQIIEILEYCVEQAKQSGSTQVTLATEETFRKLARQKAIVNRMKQALLQQDFQIYLQPIHSLANGKFVSAEALLRLTDVNLGRIPPSEFIPLAEKNNLIIDIGYQVLDQVCQFIQNLDENLFEIDFVSVNFSALQMQDPLLVDRVMAIIRKNGVATTKIRIEITESAFIDNYANVMSVIGQLRNQGIRFCLDDFGTGYSNLETVLKLDLEYIKIDKSILYNAVQSNKYFELMKGLVKIFSDLGIQVVIEGVENEIHHDMVLKVNAQLIQGFLFAKPIPAADSMAYFIKTVESPEDMR